MTVPGGVGGDVPDTLIPSNVTFNRSTTDGCFWQVSGLVQLGTTTHCEGIVPSQTSISLQTGASLRGRLPSQTAVTLDTNEVVEP